MMTQSLIAIRHEKTRQQHEQKRYRNIGCIPNNFVLSKFIIHRQKLYVVGLVLVCYLCIMLYRFCLPVLHGSKRPSETTYHTSNDIYNSTPIIQKKYTVRTGLVLTKEEELICYNSIQSIHTENITLVALDFDMTIVSIHTGGQWQKSYKDLVKYVRKEVLCVISYLFDSNISIAITTFSNQHKVISNVIDTALSNYQQHHPIGTPPTTTTTTIGWKIPIFGGDSYVSTSQELYTKGKQSQLYLAIQYFQQLKRKEQQQQKQQQQQTVANDPYNKCSIQTTVLVDDDYDNILVARHDGYRTIFYKTIQDVVQLEEQQQSLYSLVINDTTT